MFIVNTEFRHSVMKTQETRVVFMFLSNLCDPFLLSSAESS